MRWLGLLLALAVVGGSWYLFSRSGERMEVLENRIDALLESGDQEVEIPGLENEIHSLESTRTFNGILLAIGSAAFLGTLFVTFVLPSWASRVSQSVYGSNAEVDEPAVLHEARSLVAKGEYGEAVAAFRRAVEEDPANCLPWTEIARIQSRHLDQPGEAVATLNEALAFREWSPEERAFFLFRLADLYHEEPQGRGQAAEMLRRVIHEFPDSRHAMNACQRLKEWGLA
ncbi:MAG: tetratricopeptide repeat protein [Verrucomicrobiaceae bacterium]|nr:MAG: tetratricopeptide repeat protein [Verrucomicrobiaceae bacterium]